MKISKLKRFIKSYNKLPQKIKKAFDSRLVIFMKNPFEPILRNHALIGEYKEFRSIDVTGDFRALFKEYPE